MHIISILLYSWSKEDGYDCIEPNYFNNILTRSKCYSIVFSLLTNLVVFIKYATYLFCFYGNKVQLLILIIQLLLISYIYWWSVAIQLNNHLNNLLGSLQCYVYSTFRWRQDQDTSVSASCNISWQPTRSFDIYLSLC